MAALEGLGRVGRCDRSLALAVSVADPIVTGGDTRGRRALEGASITAEAEAMAVSVAADAAFKVLR